MISVITVVNKQEVYENHLERSLDRQAGVNYEIIKIDNTDNQFRSLYEAYQSAEDRINGEWLLFIHPDVEFLSAYDLADYLSKAKEASGKQPAYVLFGVAGARFGEKKSVVTRIYQGQQKEKREFGFTDTEIEEVQTVDACCFLMTRKTYEKYGFSKQVDGFHLLVEELCIRITKAREKICVLPVSLWHLSPGASLDYQYYLATKKIFRLHPELVSFNTTSFHWNRSRYLYIILNYYAIRNYIHHRIAG